MALDSKKIKEDGERLMKNGQYDKALSEFQKLVVLEAGNFVIRMRLGEIFLKMGNKEKAIEELKKGAKLAEKAKDPANQMVILQMLVEQNPGDKESADHLAKLKAEAPVPAPAPVAETAPAPDAVPEPGLELDLEVEAPKAAQAAPAEAPPAAPEPAPEEKKTYPKIALFSDLNDDEFEKVLEKTKTKSFKKESIIVKEGDKGDSICFMISGEVEIYKKDKQGKEVWITSLEEGDFFGEFGFFTNAIRNASVKAKTDVDVLEISKAEFEEVIRAFPRVSDVLMDFFKGRVLDTLLALAPLFKPLKPSERAEVRERFQLMVKDKGQAVIKEGDDGDALFLIKDGECEVSTVSEGKRIALAKLKEGDFFGEVSLITGRPRTATITALTKMRLMKLTKEDFDEICEKFPVVLEVANKFLEQRVEDTITTLLESEGKASVV
jgi:cAMP-dependent protein kinase regulator